METEESLVYQLLDQVNGGQTTPDTTVTERDIRAYLRDKRASLIKGAYKNGLRVTEMEFQSFGVVDMTFNVNRYQYDIGNLIRLQDNMGVKAYTETGYSVPIMKKEDYRLSEQSFGSKYTPKGYLDGPLLNISVGSSNTDFMDSGIGNDQNNTSVATMKMELEAVLFNPDDCPGYDWTSDPYPLNPTLLGKLKEAIKATDLQAVLMTKKDEVVNGIDDKIRYHDKDKMR